MFPPWGKLIKCTQGGVLLHRVIWVSGKVSKVTNNTDSIQSSTHHSITRTRTFISGEHQER